MRYTLAPNAVFWSWQGEGHLRGFPMVFIRLAGCSVGCPQCDTDYSAERTASAEEIAAEVAATWPRGYRDRWVWITGGEPYDRQLRPLFRALRGVGASIAVATSGVHRAITPVDWLSVSPHGGTLLQRYGSEVKLVDGLDGLDPWSWLADNPDDTTDFLYRYVQPLSVDGVECAESLARCVAFCRHHPNWALSRQDHIHWGMS